MRTFENASGRSFTAGNVVYTEYKPNSVLDISTVRSCLRILVRAAEGKKYVLLVDLTNLKAVTKDARDILAKKKSIKAAALLGNSLIHKIMATFFIGHSKPVFPVMYFTEKAEALSWLENFI